MLMTTLKELLDSLTVQANSIEDLSRDELAAIIEKNSVVNIRGLIQPDEILQAKSQLAANFQPENDRPSTGESPEDLRDNFGLESMPLLKQSVRNGTWMVEKSILCQIHASLASPSPIDGPTNHT